MVKGSQVNYFEHHIGDYDTATSHLTACEDGIYSRLIRWYMASEQPLPSDIAVVSRRVRAHSKEEKAAVRTVLAEFFKLCDDGYHQHRCDDEIARFQDKQRKARASAEARWAQSERNANASPDAMRTHSERNADGMHRAPVPKHQTPDTRHHSLQAELAGEGGAAPCASPPTPPPAFDGTNAEALNGKAVVPIAATFDLPGEWGIDAEALGFKPDEVLREAEKFRQYWTAGKGKGTRRNVKGWRQSWSNWLGKASERVQR